MCKNAVPNYFYQPSISVSASINRTMSQTFIGLSILLFNYPPFIQSPPESSLDIQSPQAFSPLTALPLTLHSGLSCSCSSSVVFMLFCSQSFANVLLPHHFSDAFLVPVINVLPPNSLFIAFSGQMDLSFQNIFPLPTDMMLTLKNGLEERHCRRRDFFLPWFQYTLPEDFSRTCPSHFHAQAVRFLQSSDFQVEIILSPRRHMAKNKNSFYCHLVSGEVLLPESSEQRPGILLNTLHCTVQAPTTKNQQPKQSIVENYLE